MTPATSYLGLKLAHPFILGASPLTGNLDHVRHAEDGGCAAVVMHSLFEEEIARSTSDQDRHAADCRREGVSADAAQGHYHLVLTEGERLVGLISDRDLGGWRESPCERDGRWPT
jgi:hypothetical protein